MKKIIALIIFIVIIITSYFAAGPFITIYKIKAGIKNQEPDKISAQIDYSALRTNLKEQFNAAVMKKAASDLEGNPFAALGMAFATKLVDNMVDAFVTPTALTNLMAGKAPAGSNEADSKKPEPFKGARYSYDSLSKFSAWVKIDDKNEMRFVFTRNGLSWKLSNIQFPANVLSGDKSISPRRQSTKDPTVSPRNTANPPTFKVVLRNKDFRQDDERMYQNIITINLAFTNITGKDVRAFDGILEFTDLLNNEIHSARVTINEQITAGATLEWTGNLDYNKYIDSHQRLRNEKIENIKVYFKTHKILFSDGTTQEFE